MRSSFWERWARGFGLTILAAVVFGIAWGIPRGVGQLIADAPDIPEGLRTLLLILWLGLMLLFCPVIFEWLARKTGLAPGRRGDAVPPG
jgi:hypothetical protein